MKKGLLSLPLLERWSDVSKEFDYSKIIECPYCTKFSDYNYDKCHLGQQEVIKCECGRKFVVKCEKYEYFDWYEFLGMEEEE